MSGYQQLGLDANGSPGLRKSLRPFSGVDWTGAGLVAPDLAPARRRWTYTIVTLCCAIPGAALIIDFAKGA